MSTDKDTDSVSHPRPPPSRDEVLIRQGEQEQWLREKETMETLKPCPFCHCDPVHSRIEQACKDEWCVVCEVCSATGPRCDTQQRAIWYWNQGNIEKTTL